jgi:hypothetical protein
MTELITHGHMRVVTEIDLQNGCEHTRYIIYPLDGGKDFCYKSRTASNSFFHGMKKRNYYFPNGKRKPPKFLYHVQDLWEKNMHDDCFRESMARCGGKIKFRDVPTDFADNIFDMFKMIGWDNKTKKWLK